ncbi:hypothetical protein [Methylobacterium oxalidis]|uniref:Uncharacterized protein n=1 Tax=Methylobacterium oxalidis TaxID=944322 RepID=A0A512J8Z7_9HYPH|nr:hypothetical protein [Methylobacterium oxalidis]GEP06440.1 hypothetical protein MOX02_44780 [Methylobacterium oxalidis]GJE33534.1 hypothetical protein LDDCCGHA_3734 [Methylobacterium oxalidis]GLS65480.1 hypothetical protein GCM10007888_38620 [Methylobacterium oxalidis]
MTRIPLGLPEPVQRIFVWCALGCHFVYEAGRWRIEPPASMRFPVGTAPTPIQDRTAHAAVLAGAPVTRAGDLFAADAGRAA